MKTEVSEIKKMGNRKYVPVPLRSNFEIGEKVIIKKLEINNL